MPQHIVTANPSEVELDDAPFPREWVLEGTPRARAKEIARSDDASMKVIVWSCTRGPVPLAIRCRRDGADPLRRGRHHRP